MKNKMPFFKRFNPFYRVENLRRRLERLEAEVFIAPPPVAQCSVESNSLDTLDVSQTPVQSTRSVTFMRDSRHKDVVFIETTMKCNMNCLFCSYGVQERECTTLDTSVVKSLLDELKMLPKEIQPKISYEILGEPLLNRDIFEIVRYTKSCGLYASFITNGLLLNRNVAQKVIDSGLDSIHISLHTLTNDKALMEKLRGVSIGIDDYLRNIFEFLHELMRLESRCEVVVYIQGKDNIDTFPGLGKYYKWKWYDDDADLMEKLKYAFGRFAKLGEDFRHDHPDYYAAALSSIPDGWRDWLSQKRFVDSMDTVSFDSYYGDSAHEHFQGFMFYPNMLLQFKSFGLNTLGIKYMRRAFQLTDEQCLFVEETERPFSCPHITTSCGVLSNGKVVLCCGDQSGESDIGNIHSGLLVDILQKDEYKKYITDSHLSKMCRRCHGRIILLEEAGESSVFSGDVSIVAQNSVFINGIGKYYFILGEDMKHLNMTVTIHGAKAFDASIRISSVLRARVDHDGFQENFAVRHTFSETENDFSVNHLFSREYLYKIGIIPILCENNLFEVTNITVC